VKRFGVTLGLIAAAAAAAVAAASHASPSGSGLPLRQAASVPLPGPANRFDYQSVDPTTGRLYIAHMNAGQLLVFDLHTRKVVQTITVPGVHGVIAVPQLHRVYASATDARELFTIDARTGRVLNRAPAGSYPDGLVYDPAERHVFVSDESGGVETVFDVKGRRIATVQLRGGAGNVKYDSVGGKVLVDVQTRNQVAVIDPRSNRVVRRISVPGCESPHGLLIDAPSRLAFVACDGNARLLTLDLKTMKFTGNLSVGSGPDVLAFDSRSKRLYVAAESGVVTVAVERGRKLVKLGQGFLAPHAHTVAVDPSTHLVYFPLESGQGGRPELRIMAPTGTIAAVPSGEKPEQPGGPVPAPARPGAWRQIGGSVTADPGEALHFYRIVQNPETLGVVVTSPSPSTIRVDWSSYCEFSSDDDKTLEDGGTVTGVHSVTAYPPSFPGATLCYVTVSADAGGTTKLTSAIFAT
jgi:DNA-binding beta-propeller fold protein YncE